MTRFRLATAMAASLILGGVLMGSAPASSVVPAPAKWRVAASYGATGGMAFTAVTADSATSAWAFSKPNLPISAKPTAWRLTGSVWARQVFPGLPGELVYVAASSGPSNVWAFTSRNRVLRWNGVRWMGMAKFSGEGGMLSGAVVLSPDDVWVFGASSGVGDWHFNGARWQHSGSLALVGAGAISQNDIWAFGGTTVANWNGRVWAPDSVTSLLPGNTQLCHSRVTAIDAESPRNVWAAATGGCQDFQGPFVLLHFNGSAWSRAAIDLQMGSAQTVTSDGHGGIWIPVRTGSPAASSMLHFLGGRLSSAKLPYDPERLGLSDASAGHDSVTAFAVGFYTASDRNGSTMRAVILRFGT